MPGRKVVYSYVQETKDINYKEQNNVEVQTFKEISSVAVWTWGMNKKNERTCLKIYWGWG